MNERRTEYFWGKSIIPERFIFLSSPSIFSINILSSLVQNVIFSGIYGWHCEILVVGPLPKPYLNLLLIFYFIFIHTCDGLIFHEDFVA